jgi:tRNA G18 (ribose-2'-O)-methylase SpoU
MPPLVPRLDASAEEVREALRPLRHRFSVALLSFGNAFATGAVIRVAHSFLVREIFLIGEEPHYEKASMGMEKYETIVIAKTEEEFCELLGSRPLWAVEKDHARRSLHGVDRFPDDVVFAFGSERAGLSAALISRADDVIGIPMYGVNHSFPVAVAAGIVMHEWARKRYVEGGITRG